MIAPTTKWYKRFKLVTYRNPKSGNYTTYIFNGAIKSIDRFTVDLKRDAIGIAESAIDYGEYKLNR